VTDTPTERRPTGEIPAMQPTRVNGLTSKILIGVITAVTAVSATCAVGIAKEWVQAPWATREELGQVRGQVQVIRTTQVQIQTTLDNLDKTVRDRLPAPKKKRRQ